MSHYTQGIDLSYRPSNYFWAEEKGISLISDIKGAERRKLYQTALQGGHAEMVTPELLQHALPSELRQSLGRLHPNFLGGEYLPSRRLKEVEIARITIASTTQDVICIYARPVGQRIHYRVVDEYCADTLNGRGSRTSLYPLNLLQLTNFFLKNWNMILCLDSNFESYGYPRDEIHNFIVDASSSFYAEFNDLIHARIDEWLDKLLPHKEEDEFDNE